MNQNKNVLNIIAVYLFLYSEELKSVKKEGNH